jgi:uncharacterized protein YecE (DUF72 family)
MAAKKGKIYIGTSGWHYQHWQGTFYPADLKPRDYLNYYIQHFSTVEVNNSFYKLPSAGTFAAWRQAVPDDFSFAVKANRYITHMKKLKDPKEPVIRFMDAISFLEEKLGPILFQLPPFWNLNYERLQQFLESLPAGFRYTFEFRNDTWYTEEVYTLLRQHNIAFCLYELERHHSPLVSTADFVYLRLHGPGDKYEGSYTDEVLQEWSRQLLEWSSRGQDVYVYFDNDQYGYAAFNARTLQELVMRAG